MGRSQGLLRNSRVGFEADSSRRWVEWGLVLDWVNVTQGLVGTGILFSS